MKPVLKSDRVRYYRACGKILHPQTAAESRFLPQVQRKIYQNYKIFDNVMVIFIKVFKEDYFGT